MKLPIAVVATAISVDPRQAAARSRQLGFAGLQFDVSTNSFDLAQLSQSGRREFRHVMSAADQQLSSLRANAGAKGFGPKADVDRALDRLERSMDAAKGVTTPLLCVDLGPLPEPARAAKPRPKLTEAQAGLIIIPKAAAPDPAPEPATQADHAFESTVDAAMAELGKRADRYGVVLAFRSDLASFAALDRALAAAACPWFGVDFDPSALLRDRWSGDEVFSRIGPLIRHVRARDAVAGHDKRTRPATIGRGDVNWGETLALLDEAGYSGWLSIDPLELPDRVASAHEALEHLRAVGG